MKNKILPRTKMVGFTQHQKMVRGLLFLILALAVFLRFYQLTTAPPSLNWDEVSHGYNAYSILKTGKDEWGVSWPTIFRAYGDYKLPVYIYLTVASEAVFGLNEFAVRFPSALAGVLSVLLTYLLSKKLFSKEKRITYHLSLITSLLLAVSPWHLFLSRPAFEANLASFLVMAGIYFFLEGLERGWFLPISIFLLGLSAHTYNSARIFVPLFLVTLVSLYYSNVLEWARVKRKELIVAALLFLLFFIPLTVSFISSEGRARLRWVTIIDQGTINRINEARTSSTFPKPLPTLIHNKATYFMAIFSKNYLSNFSPVYLFFKGGSNYQYNIPGKGIIYPIQAPFILLGFYWLFKNWRKKESRLILLWWLLAVIPAAATRDNPHVLRTILALPIPQILTALGLWQIWEWWSRKIKHPTRLILPVVYGFILLIFVANFLNGYFGFYRKDYSWSWQYGYKKVANYIKSHYNWSEARIIEANVVPKYNDYDKIFITKKYGEPHEFLLFYLVWDPEGYRTDPNLVRYFKTDWYWVDSFDKFVFINDWEVREMGNGKWEMGNGKVLLITSPGNYPEAVPAGRQGWSTIETINFLDGKPAFEIVESSSTSDVE